MITREPSLMIMASFASVIVIGTALLLLPVSTHHGIAPLDAFFTATSAVCVTGLTVLDTGGDFTLFGQLVILALIQVGGLGILTLSVLFLGMLTGRLGLDETELIENTLSQNFVEDLYAFLKRILIFVATAEGIGAILLGIFFSMDFGPARGAYLGIFHSVSAFCNAGFSPFSESLEDYTASPGINLVVASLIVIGGLGFVVVEEIRRTAVERSFPKGLSFHSKVVISTTGLLVFIGAALILYVEHGRLFESLGHGERVLAALFQSITCRTAGFSTVRISDLQNATIFFMIFLMLIGGSPGSTAGGLKTTSFAVFIALVIGRIRSRPGPEIFGRTVSKATMERLLTLLVAAGLVLLTATFFLMISEDGTPWVTGNARGFLAVVFEAASAFGTVGLSMGITPHLSSSGKFIIICLMFLGRVGPLSIAILLTRPRKGHDYTYPEEEIIIG